MVNSPKVLVYSTFGIKISDMKFSGPSFNSTFFGGEDLKQTPCETPEISGGCGHRRCGLGIVAARQSTRLLGYRRISLWHNHQKHHDHHNHHENHDHHDFVNQVTIWKYPEAIRGTNTIEGVFLYSNWLIKGEGLWNVCGYIGGGGWWVGFVDG